ncbi:MAG: hypothetical protein GX053_12540 [Tissierella sp.]|nr:hypothetical protein [Tissierella sp.]
MTDFATMQDIVDLWRPMTPDETIRATALLPVVSDSLRVESDKVGKDLDKMVNESETYANVVKSVVVDIVARTLMTSTNQEPMTQMSESALGYSFQGSFLVPGGGLFIKKSELARLGLRKQRYGVIDFYG